MSDFTDIPGAYRPDEDTELLSINDAAPRARMSHWTLRALIRKGKIPAFGRPGRIRVRLCDILPKYDVSRLKDYCVLAKPNERK